MSTIKVDTIATRTGSGNITLSNNVASLTSAGAISGTNLSASGTLAVTGHGSVGSAGTVASTRALTVVGATDGTGSSILVGYNSSLASKFSVRDDGYTNIGNGLNLADGNLAFATGHGIDFTNAADVASGETTTSSILDDYEEGTFTPSVGGNATYNSQIGKYVKIGRSVTIKLEIHINALGTGSTSTITGLPFGGDTEVPLAMAKATNTSAAFGDITARLSGTTLYYMTRQGNVSVQGTNTAIHANNCLIQVGGSYVTGS